MSFFLFAIRKMTPETGVRPGSPISLVPEPEETNEIVNTHPENIVSTQVVGRPY